MLCANERKTRALHTTMSCDICEMDFKCTGICLTWAQNIRNKWNIVQRLWLLQIMFRLLTCGCLPIQRVNIFPSTDLVLETFLFMYYVVSIHVENPGLFLLKNMKKLSSGFEAKTSSNSSAQPLIFELWVPSRYALAFFEIGLSFRLPNISIFFDISDCIHCTHVSTICHFHASFKFNELDPQKKQIGKKAYNSLVFLEVNSP